MNSADSAAPAITPLDAWISGKLDRPLSQLNQYRLERLNQVLAYARERSPFYRDHLDRRAPQYLASLADWEKVPFVTAADLRAQHQRMLCVSHGEVARVVTLRTSGTTAEPKRIFFSEPDLELTRDFFGVGMSTLVGPGDKVLIMLPGPTPHSVADLLGQGLARIPVHSRMHWPVTDLAAVAGEIREGGFNALVGAPAQVMALARHPAGRALGADTIKAVLLSTDYIPRAVVAEIEAVWGCPVFEHYGMTEMGYGGGVQCAAQRGYHLREADLFFEVIDPHTGRPCPPGEPGEVVFTTLTRQAMPLLRYRTGDLAAWEQGPCPCGSALPLLGLVQGRLERGVVLSTGRRLTMSELDEAVLPVPGVVGFAARYAEGDRALRLTLYCAPDEEAAAVRQARDVLGQLLDDEDCRIVVESRPLEELAWDASGMIKREIGGIK